MPFPEEAIWDLVNDGWDRMSFKQRNLWAAIKRMPEEWELKGHGRCWVVAIIGERVVYYNHYERGFNFSSWTRYGVIEHFQALQFGLEEAVQAQLDLISSGVPSEPTTSGPFAGELSRR